MLYPRSISILLSQLKLNFHETLPSKSESGGREKEKDNQERRGQKGLLQTLLKDTLSQRVLHAQSVLEQKHLLAAIDMIH